MANSVERCAAEPADGTGNDPVFFLVVRNCGSSIPNRAEITTRLGSTIFQLLSWLCSGLSSTLLLLFIGRASSIMPVPSFRTTLSISGRSRVTSSKYASCPAVRASANSFQGAQYVPDHSSGTRDAHLEPHPQFLLGTISQREYAGGQNRIPIECRIDSVPDCRPLTLLVVLGRNQSLLPVEERDALCSFPQRRRMHVCYYSALCVDSSSSIESCHGSSRLSDPTCV